MRKYMFTSLSPEPTWIQKLIMKYFINEFINMLIIDHVLCILYFTRDVKRVVQEKDDKYASKYIWYKWSYIKHCNSVIVGIKRWSHWGEEMAQLVSVGQTIMSTWARPGGMCLFTQHWRDRDRKTLGTHWPFSLPQSPSPRSVRPHVRKQGAYSRSPQSAKMQRTTDCGVANPNGYIHNPCPWGPVSSTEDGGKITGVTARRQLPWDNVFLMWWGSCTQEIWTLWESKQTWTLKTPS